MSKPISPRDLEAIFLPRAPEPFEASELPVGAAVVEWLAEYLPAVALGLVVGMMMTVGLAFVWAAVLS